MPVRSEVLQKVRKTVLETLGADWNGELDDVKPESTLQGDLGLESIDFLDLVFRLEREFNIRIPRNELFPESIFQGDPDYVQNGMVTQKGLNEMREKMSFADITGFAKNPEITATSDLFTVEAVTNYIQGKLTAKEGV